MQPFHTYFDQIYLICPKWAPLKKLLFLQKLRRLGIRGLLIQGNAHDAITDLHRQVLSHAIHHDYKRILILQDDVIFHKDFHQQFSTHIHSIPDDWKLLFLGDHPFQGTTGDGKPAKILGAFAVGLHRSVFNWILSILDNVTGTLDAVHLQKIKAEHPTKCLRFEPSLVLSGLVDEFALAPSQLDAQCRALGWELSEYDYPFVPDLVSLIMPVYNRAGILEKAIRSSLRQSYQHIEIIAIDDASTDGTVEVVKRLMAEDDRIKLIEQRENRGVGYARSEGIRAANSSFIAFHDSDDIMLKDRLVKQLLPIYEEGVLFTMSRVIRSHCYMEELSMEMEGYSLDLARSRTRTKPDGFPVGDDRERIYPATVVFRREVFEKWGLYWDARYAEDYEMIERILYHQTGMHFGEREETPLMYLEKMGFIENTFAFIPEVLCIASKRQEDNLTVEYLDQQHHIATFKQTYRDRLLGKGTYTYPQLTPSEHLPSMSFSSFEKVANFLIKPQSAPDQEPEDPLLPLLHDQQAQLAALKQSLSWRITKPLRWLGKLFNAFLDG